MASWQEDNSSGLLLKLPVDPYLLVFVLETGLLDLFVEQADLGLAKMEKCAVQVCLGKHSQFTQLANRQHVLILLIKLQQDGSLRHADLQQVLLHCVGCHDVHVAELVQPVDLPLRVLAQVEGLVCLSSLVKNRRQLHQREIIETPHCLGKHLHREVLL